MFNDDPFFLDQPLSPAVKGILSRPIVYGRHHAAPPLRSPRFAPGDSPLDRFFSASGARALTWLRCVAEHRQAARRARNANERNLNNELAQRAQCRADAILRVMQRASNRQIAMRSAAPHDGMRKGVQAYMREAMGRINDAQPTVADFAHKPTQARSHP